MFGGSYFGRALFGGQLAVTSQSVLTAAGVGVAQFVSVASPSSVLAAAGSGTATFRVLPILSAAGVGTLSASGVLGGVFKPAWAANTNRVFGPPSPETT